MSKQTYGNTNRHFNRYSELILNHSAEIFQVLDGYGKIHYVNSAVEMHSGYTPEEMVGRSSFDFVHPDDREAVSRAFKKLRKKSGVIEKLQVRALHKDGEYRILESTGKSVKDKDGKTKIIVQPRDITAQKIIERKLKLKEEKFQKIFNNAGVGIAILDLNGKLIEINTQLTSFLGYTKQELLGKKFTDVTQENHVAIDRKLFKELVDNKTATYNLEKRFLLKNGETRWGRLSASLIKDEYGKPQYVIRIIEDIQDRKRLENIQINFLSIVTHELRTPITTIKLVIQQMIKDWQKKPESDLVLRQLQLVNEEITRITSVINDIYDIRLLETGQLKLHKEYVNISQIILNAITEISLNADGHIIKFTPRNSWEVLIDKDRLKQVLLNLLNNAVKYSAPDAAISVDLQKNSTQIIVSVQNKGKPIPQGDLPFIFQQFYRVNKEHKMGLGVGLWVCSKVIQQHGGKIWAESDNKNETTTFFFSLPLD